jgi:hypothetical protein
MSVPPPGANGSRFFLGGRVSAGERESKRRCDDEDLFVLHGVSFGVMQRRCAGRD